MIEYATACYTGGNIYCYYGKLKDGNYFMCSDDWCGDSLYYVLVVDTEIDMDESWYLEWEEEHKVKEIGDEEAETFWKEMIQWINNNRPDGNYLLDEINNRINYINNP